MYGKLLPIGSVVQLHNGEKRLIVVGRVLAGPDDVVHDYAGVLYPEGMGAPSALYFFEDAAIEHVFGVGFQDAEEADFKDAVLSRLGRLEVRDGEIVSVD